VKEYQIGDLYYVQVENNYYLVKDVTSANIQIMDIKTGHIQNLFKGEFIDRVLKKVS
jgi:hypothetical protein